jgi:anti-sigma factor RsiW
MKCEEILLRFPDALEEPAPGGADPEVREHLASCPACAEAWRGMEAAVGGAGHALAGEEAPPEGAPGDYWARFLPRLRGRLEVRRVPSRRGLHVWALPAAAALVLGFSLGILAGGLFSAEAPRTVYEYVDVPADSDPFAQALEEVMEADWELDASLDDLTDEEQLLLIDELAREIT